MATSTYKGNDVIYAGTGDDIVYGNAGDDEIYGGSGNMCGGGAKGSIQRGGLIEFFSVVISQKMTGFAVNNSSI